MKVEIKIKTKAISTNNAYYRNRKLTQEARKWRANFLCQLQSQDTQRKFAKIRANFSKDKHALKFLYIWFIPESFYFTKKGHISRRSLDVDNVLKIPTDCICNSKFTTDWLLEREGRESKFYSSIKALSNLNIDDQYIYEVASRKMPTTSDEYFVILQIEVVDKPIAI